jgi:hypothetical protein
MMAVSYHKAASRTIEVVACLPIDEVALFADNGASQAVRVAQMLKGYGILYKVPQGYSRFFGKSGET